MTEGGQHINPYVDGLKNKSENSVAPVTGSHISYTLWHPGVCPAPGSGQERGKDPAAWSEPGNSTLGTPQPGPQLSSGFAKVLGILNSLDATTIQLLLKVYLQLQLESFSSSQ